MIRDIEKIKKEIECFTIQDLAEIIRTEPLILEKNSIFNYNKKQREELKSCMLEIAKKTLDLAMLEEKFLLENMNKHLDRKIYNALKDLFRL